MNYGSDYAAILAYQADCNDGLVPDPLPWNQLDPGTRNGYRRAVEGLAQQGAVTEIEYERLKQVKKGYNADHDDKYTDAQLVAMAMAYAVLGVMQQTRPDAAMVLHGYPPVTEFTWPSPDIAWRPESTPEQNLIKAAALLAAEIDRLFRKAAPSTWD